MIIIIEKPIQIRLRLAEKKGFGDVLENAKCVLSLKQVSTPKVTYYIFYSLSRVGGSNTLTANKKRTTTGALFVGGELGIRTPGRFQPTTVFKTAAFDRSANSPFLFMLFAIARLL